MLLVGCSATSQTQESSSLPSYVGDLRGAVIDPPRALEDFSLASTDGKPFTLSEHRGETLLLYFGYRTCPDFCPTTFAELLRVYQELKEPADKLKIVFVTVDPERDDIENLTLYTHAFHEDFIGLRGEGDSLKQVMNEFGIVATKRQLADSPLSYLIDHTASVFLIAPDGTLQVQFLYGTSYRDIVHDVHIVMDAA
jgi:protein SCO1/2